MINKIKNERAITTFKDGSILAVINLILNEIVLHQVANSGLAGIGIFFGSFIGFSSFCIIFIIVKNIIKYNNFKDFLVRILLSFLWFLLIFILLTFTFTQLLSIFK